ncbi:MAG: hypothetical protein HZA46_19035, partial [Planctomycetales bacterium]|nr:hypothetical protein [Planctomycetales bacterium]
MSSRSPSFGSAQSSNVIKIVGLQLQTNPFWYVMPVYDRTLLSELPSLVGDEKRVSKVFSSILDAVEYAHGEGVIHRDLKAANVIRQPSAATKEERCKNGVLPSRCCCH